MVDAKSRLQHIDVLRGVAILLVVRPPAVNLVLRLLAGLGVVSYSVYLFHFAILDALFYAEQVAIRHFHVLPDHYLVKFSLMLSGCLFLAYLLGRLSYRFLEVPAMDWGRRLTTSGRASSGKAEVPATE